jgi:hypothetical protein
LNAVGEVTVAVPQAEEANDKSSKEIQNEPECNATFRYDSRKK